jgi:L-threonylcarbamoyladenylate synthase
LKTAADAVAKGGLICYPTDTVYGLGCDPLNEAAVKRLIRSKGGRTKPLPVLVKSLEDTDKVANVTENARLLAWKFWPGPLTIVLPAKDNVPLPVAPDGTVGVRSPNNALCLNLIGLCGGLLVGTSANITGQTPAVSAEEAARYLGDHVEVILDGGKATLGVPSTVVDVVRGVRIRREGPISAEEIFRALRNRNIT